jgi:phosphopantetheinyl transferase (holo-ACP synthase)
MEEKEYTGLNGYTLKECLSKSLSEMYSNPQYYEDLQVMTENLLYRVKDLEDKIRRLTIVLEHYELKAMEKERTQILYRAKYRKDNA